MDAKEAIEILQEEWDFAQEPAYVKNAIQMAIESLGRDTPKKPNGEYCPNCKRHLRKPKVSCGYTGKVKRRNGDNYCPSCGQAIEWEEQS